MLWKHNFVIFYEKWKAVIFIPIYFVIIKALKVYPTVPLYLFIILCDLRHDYLSP